jgi:HPt (histidine-containing phosphotransfer) domain-containing protein
LSEQKRVVADEDRVRSAMTVIGAQARTSNLARADHIDTALGRLESGELSADDRDLAVRSAHQLAGSAGTFGLRPASRLASRLERFFTELDVTGEPEERRRSMNGDLATARSQLTELRTRLDDPPDLD